MPVNRLKIIALWMWIVCAFSSPVVAQTFSNSGSITINDNQAANPFPSSITITGLDPTLTYTLTSVLLRNVSHTATGDLDVLLVGPGGVQTLLMSDNFGDLILNNVNLQFSDNAPLAMGSSGNLSMQEQAAFEGSFFDVGGFGQPRANGGTATFQTSNIGLGDFFSPPAPPGPYTNIPLSTFTTTGANLNGQSFRLFVQDDAFLDNGAIAGGWEITLNAVVIPEPTAMFLVWSSIYAIFLAWRRRLS